MPRRFPRATLRRSLAWPRVVGVAAMASLALGLGACSSLNTRHDLTDALRPYRPDVIQGNFVSAEMAARLKPGMTRDEVRDILGTPLLQDVFHAERWEYVFSLRRGYATPIVRRFTVYFDKDGRMLRSDGDPLPSEDQFVAQINALHQGWTKPKTLTAEQLQAEIDAAAKVAPPAPPASAPSGPLTMVAPAAEIERLKALTPAAQ